MMSKESAKQKIVTAIEQYENVHMTRNTLYAVVEDALAGVYDQGVEDTTAYYEGDDEDEDDDDGYGIDLDDILDDEDDGEDPF